MLLRRGQINLAALLAELLTHLGHALARILHGEEATAVLPRRKLPHLLGDLHRANLGPHIEQKWAVLALRRGGSNLDLVRRCQGQS